MQKIGRTIYFPKDLDAVINERIGITGRNRSVEVERLIKKALKLEQEQNNAAANITAEPGK